MEGFRKFLLRGNVVELAVAFVVGAAFTNVINAFAKSIITPLIGAFGGTPDFSALSFTVNNSRFAVGEFINAAIAFLIVATVVYFFVVVPMSAAIERLVPATPKTRECPECLSKIPVAARRCAFCTSEVSPTS